MLDIDKFCRENNIRYSLAFGTLLGAVRHKGFIPWDDDMDIYMLREDFDRFVKTYKSDKYHLLYNTRNKDEFLANGYAKVHYPQTFSKFKNTVTQYGVYVDVFPVDSVPEKEEDRPKYMHKVISLHNRIHHRQKTDWFSKLKTYRHSLDWWWNKSYDLVHNGQYDSSPYGAALLGPTDRVVLEKSMFDNLTDMEFEGEKFLCFADTHDHLVKVFGEDYMIPREWSHNFPMYWKEGAETNNLKSDPSH